MLSGHEDLQAVAAQLAGWDGDREGLVVAAEAYWRAAYHAPEWPQPFSDWNERVLSLLFKHGVLRDTIARSTDDEVRELAIELRLFSDAALKAPGMRAPHWTDAVRVRSAGEHGSGGPLPIAE